MMRSFDGTARDIVVRYLDAMQRRDFEAASRLVAPDAVLIFPGDRRIGAPGKVAANSARRYRRIAKRIDGWDVIEDGNSAIVICRGTLYGEWIDGGTFSGIRFLDRFEVADGKIARQEVWNDAAEVRLAMMAAAAAPGWSQGARRRV